MTKRIKVNRQARTIKVRGDFPGEPVEVYTRYSKREYEQRRENFDDYGSDSVPDHLGSYSYDEWTEWGAQGGRPRKWANEAQRKQAKRAQKKLEQGRTLTLDERKLLGLVRKRPGAYRSELGRAMTAAERKGRWRQRQRS